MADDLAQALNQLAWNRADANKVANAAMFADGDTIMEDGDASAVGNRTRSGSTVLFQPVVDGEHEMPGITVDDFSDNEMSPVSGAPSPIPNSVKASFQHTPRPPVETMTDA